MSDIDFEDYCLEDLGVLYCPDIADKVRWGEQMSEIAIQADEWRSLDLTHVEKPDVMIAELNDMLIKLSRGQSGVYPQTTEVFESVFEVLLNFAEKRHDEVVREIYRPVIEGALKNPELAKHLFAKSDDR